MRQTLEQTIAKFNSIHKNRYDYSLVDSSLSDNKVKIICNVHGIFEQKVSEHKRGRGCNLCNGWIKKTQEEVINEFILKHGNTYDYSLVDYTLGTNKVKIICKKHGVFEQKPSIHKLGAGCPRCHGRNKSIEELLEEFNTIHNFKYSYNLSVLPRANEKIKIICPYHGLFEQLVSSHRHGNGCFVCGMNLTSDKYLIQQEQSFESLTESFKLELKCLHGDKYDYSLVNYVDHKTRFKLICKKHGLFSISKKMFHAPELCIKCRPSRKTLTTEQIITDFKKVHNNTYDYSLVNYIDNNTKVKIICKEHGIFEQVQIDHKRGHGCNKCFPGGFNVNKPGLLYYIKINKNNKIAYKIGITNKTVKFRFKNEMKYITILRTIKFENGLFALREEQRILNQFSYAKWTEEDLLKKGNSEMFNIDIFGLDYNLNGTVS